MKRILCFAVTVFVMISTFASISGAVSYTDLQPTHVLSSDKGYYVNSSCLTDDYLQLRANCYGFALRMHYQSNGFPDKGRVKENGVSYIVDCYKQQPGEFYDRTSTQTSYYEFIEEFTIDSTHQVYQNLRRDFSRLGYTAEIVASIYQDSYVPPSATADTSRRLMILVTGNFGSFNDYHFYMQNSDNTWSHKPGASPATGYCAEHTSVVLNNSNISQHIHCNGYNNSNALLFYVNVPGMTDMSHNDGHGEDPYTNTDATPIYVTSIRYCDGAGGIVRSAKAQPSISDEKRIRGFIDHKGDVDNFIFDVTESGAYSIEVTAPTSYPIYFQFAQVTNIDSVSFSTTYTTASTGQKVIYQNLVAGNRYCLRVYSGNQTNHESYRYYDVKIIP